MMNLISQIDEDGRLRDHTFLKKHPREVFVKSYQWMQRFSLLETQLEEIEKEKDPTPSAAPYKTPHHLFPSLYFAMQSALTTAGAQNERTIALFLNSLALPILALHQGSMTGYLEYLFTKRLNTPLKGASTGFVVHHPCIQPESALAFAIGAHVSGATRGMPSIPCCFIGPSCASASQRSFLKLAATFRAPALLIDLPVENERRSDSPTPELSDMSETIQVNSVDFVAAYDETARALQSLFENPRPLVLRFMKPPSHTFDRTRPESSAGDPDFVRVHGLNPLKRAYFFLRRYELLSETDHQAILSKAKAELRNALSQFLSISRPKPADYFQHVMEHTPARLSAQLDAATRFFSQRKTPAAKGWPNSLPS